MIYIIFIQYTLYNMQYTMRIIYYTRYIIQCTLYMIESLSEIHFKEQIKDKLKKKH